MKRYLFVFSFVTMMAFAQDRMLFFNGNDESQDNRELPDLPELADLGNDFDGDFFYDIEINTDDQVISIGDPETKEDLGLSKEQMEKIRKIRTDARKKGIPMHSDLQLKKIELRELMDTDTPDRDKITAKIKEMDAIRTQLNINRTMTRLDVRSVFTKEQREKMEKMKMERRMMIHGPGGEHKMFFRKKMKD